MYQKITKLFKGRIKIAGLLLYLAGIIMFMGIITAESMYPLDKTYTIRQNEISDLGATKPPHSVITQPSATIFNTTMIVTGVFILCANLILYFSYQKLLLSIPLGFLGIGIIGAGIFPGNIIPWHSLFAFILFFFGGITAIVSYKCTKSPLNYVFLMIGILSLFLFFTYQLYIPILGRGGIERFIAYPLLFWMMGFGTYLIGVKANMKS